jgi:hypothetical protein
MWHGVFSRAHPLEWMFAVATVIGWMLSIKAYLGSTEYVQFQEERTQRALEKNGHTVTEIEKVTLQGLHISARQQLAIDVARMVSHTIMLMAAVGFIFTAPPPPDYRAIPQTLIGLVAWILLSIEITFFTRLNLLFRRQLEELAEKHERLIELDQLRNRRSTDSPTKENTDGNDA